MLETIKSLVEIENKTLDDVIKIAKEKYSKRGGFEKKIFLENVENDK